MTEGQPQKHSRDLRQHLHERVTLLLDNAPCIVVRWKSLTATSKLHLLRIRLSSTLSKTASVKRFKPITGRSTGPASPVAFRPANGNRQCRPWILRKSSLPLISEHDTFSCLHGHARYHVWSCVNFFLLSYAVALKSADQWRLARPSCPGSSDQGRR